MRYFRTGNCALAVMEKQSLIKKNKHIDAGKKNAKNPIQFLQEQLFQARKFSLKLIYYCYMSGQYRLSLSMLQVNIMWILLKYSKFSKNIETRRHSISLRFLIKRIARPDRIVELDECLLVRKKYYKG